MLTLFYSYCICKRILYQHSNTSSISSPVHVMNLGMEIYIYFVLKTHKKFTRHATNGVQIMLMIKPIHTLHRKKQRYNLTFISIVQYWATSYISKSRIFHWGVWKKKKKTTKEANCIEWTFFFSWESFSNTFPLS